MNRNQENSRIKRKENLNKRTRVSILGARGIGKVHARTFSKLGTEVCSILSSSESSGWDTSKELKNLFGIKAEPYTSLQNLLSSSCPDAVSVCTPMEMHFDHILQALEANVPVFCEKPLFWSNGLSYKEYRKKMEIISNHPNRALFVNNSSASYINFLENHLKDLGKVDTFKLQFHTNGPHRKRNIAEDLLPHGLAMIIELLGKQKISKLNELIKENSYTCNFYFDDSFIEFDFVESKNVEKKLLFKINDVNFLRVQEGNISSYKVYLKNLNSDEVFQIIDPFELYISRFVKFCQKPISKRNDAFDNSAYNMELMANILLRN